MKIGEFLRPFSLLVAAIGLAACSPAQQTHIVEPPPATINASTLVQNPCNFNGKIISTDGFIEFVKAETVFIADVPIEYTLFHLHASPVANSQALLLPLDGNPTNNFTSLQHVKVTGKVTKAVHPLFFPENCYINTSITSIQALTSTISP